MILRISGYIHVEQGIVRAVFTITGSVLQDKQKFTRQSEKWKEFQEVQWLDEEK